jgi:trigger factor
MTGATVGETREFELTYPEGEEYGELAGKPVRFTVTVNKIESVTLPALNDDLAARATAEEEKQLTLLELRMRIRENLERNAQDQATTEHGRKTLGEMVARATIRYPEALVNDQIESYLRRMDNDLRQRGLTLDDYMKILQKTRDDLYAEYRDMAVSTVERALVMRSVAEAEGLEVTDEQLEEEIEQAASGFGDRAGEYRRLFRDRNMRDSLRNDLLSQKTMERISLIGRGEAPELPAPDEAASTQSTDAVPEEKGESA